MGVLLKDVLLVGRMFMGKKEGKETEIKGFFSSQKKIPFFTAFCLVKMFRHSSDTPSYRFQLDAVFFFSLFLRTPN